MAFKVFKAGRVLYTKIEIMGKVDGNLINAGMFCDDWSVGAKVTGIVPPARDRKGIFLRRDGDRFCNAVFEAEYSAPFTSAHIFKSPDRHHILVQSGKVPDKIIGLVYGFSVTRLVRAGTPLLEEL